MEQIRHGERVARQSMQQPPASLQTEALANVSHELRSPLAAIKGYTSTLLQHEREVTPEERQDFLLAIQEAGERMNTIVDRLLRVSQLEMGGIAFHRAPLNLVFLVQEALLRIKECVSKHRTAQASFPRFHFLLKNALTEDEEIIQADRALLREALDLLLENAVRYSPDGGQVSILLRSLPSTSPVGLCSPGHVPLVEICVTDQGIGIPQELLAAIFERFTRGDTSLTRETGGLGLGLTICQHIAELHQGCIWAESTQRRGSVFHLVLPASSTDTR